MPLYICNSITGAISQSEKAKIAKGITNIHCDITGAPKEFVHVFFFEDAPKQPLHGKSVFLFGNIRAGRTDEQKTALIKRIQKSICRHTSHKIDEVLVDTTEVPASWVMKGGKLLPEPDKERQWMKTLSCCQ